MKRGPARPIAHGPTFDTDYARCLGRGEDMARLKLLVDLLSRGKPLPKDVRPHRVDRDFPGMTDGHAGADFILIYRLEPRVLRLHRCGSHAELFPRSGSARKAKAVSRLP